MGLAFRDVEMRREYRSKSTIRTEKVTSKAKDKTTSPIRDGNNGRQYPPHNQSRRPVVVCWFRESFSEKMIASGSLSFPHTVAAKAREARVGALGAR